MDQQAVYNVFIGIISSGLGWYMKIIFDSVKELQADDKKIAEKVNAIEVLVAGTYCTKTDLNQLTQALFAKLDRIEEKLDKKVDK